MVDYSKWKNIEVSDDEDDTHPNIDTPSLFRWRHQARVERMEKEREEKEEFERQQKETRKKLKEAQEKAKKAGETEPVKEELKKLKKEEEALRKKGEELAKKERLTPWNVDTLSKDGFSKSLINKPKPKKELTEEEKHKQLVGFVESYEKEIKNLGMLSDYNATRTYLRDHHHLVCDDTASYLTMWCVNLEVEGKSALMERVAHQTIVMQYLLELAKQLDRDPRSCIHGFFERMKTADRQYLDAFEDELSGFITRVKGRAKVRIEEAMKKAEEEERQKRLGPGGLDPVEVMESLPEALRKCFETRNVAKLQQVIGELSKEEAAFHMRRCIDSGLWVPDAKAAGLTPANEELAKLAMDEGEEADVESAGSDSDEHYESLGEEEEKGKKDKTPDA